MKSWSIVAFASLSALVSYNTFADDAEVFKLSENPTAEQIILPADEKAFVDAIGKFDKKAIMAQLGEPATADDVRIKGTNKVVASIWHYHNINMAEDGTYYPTTELDFVEDKVVQVVFLNNDGTDAAPKEQAYTVAPEPSDTEMGDGVPLMNLDGTH
jgi:hypothetical protein